MSGSAVIVFGPTGGVASATARTAHEHGAKVYLAMRDASKSIPALDGGPAAASTFERVQADLTKPDTVRAAVSQTGAKRAFIYRVIGTEDNMKATIEGLKATGIELVVMLSSYSVQGDPRAVPQSDFIPYSHAQVEVNLDDVFGSKGYVAVRPAWFASNARQWGAAIREKGERSILYPDVIFDWISPADVGRVCGAILARGPRGVHGTDEQNVVNLCGPQLLSQRDAVAVIGKAIGKDIKVSDADEDEGLKIFTEEYKLPPPVAKYIVGNMRKAASDEDKRFEGPRYEDALGNVQKYSGQPPMKFAEWAEDNKQLFSA
jgi:uncharacterized protein YbjT (DUF2867 family)